MSDASQSAFLAPNPQDKHLALQSSVGRIRLALADDTARTGPAEKFFALCVLVFSTSAFVNLLPGEQGVGFDAEGSSIAKVVWVLLYMVLLFLVRKRAAEFVRQMWQNKLLVALLAWAFVSVVWSIERTVTIRHFVALLLSTLFGIYLAIRYGLREQLRLVSVALGFVMVASIAACLFFPKYGIRSEQSTTGPAWQGVFTHKNTLARLAVLAGLILALYFVRRVRRPTVVVGIILLFFLVILTQAKTALVYFILGMLAFPFARAFQSNPAKRRKIIALALVIFGGLTIWTYYNWENFTSALGKDPQLTGRVALWGLSMTWIAEKPFLGYGFDGFWSSSYGPAADFRIASGWLEAPHAHNGIVNLCLDLGLIGVLLFLAGFIFTYRQALRLANTSTTVEGIWPVVFLTYFIAYSLTETNFLSRTDLLWILYVAVMFGLRSNFRRLQRHG